MTFDFTNLEVSQATAWLDMPEVAPKARLLLKSATEANPGYFNAMLRKTGKRARQIVRTDRITAEDATQNRDEDRALFPRFVILKWEGIVDTDGNPVECTRETATEFCEKLPTWLFDRVRNFAATPERFLDPEDIDPDPEELSGN